MRELLRDLIEVGGHLLRVLVVPWASAWVALLFVAMLTYLASLIFRAGGAGLPALEQINRSTEWAAPLLVSSIALGFMVMAIIQLLKPSLRAAFHFRELVRWLERFRSELYPRGRLEESLARHLGDSLFRSSNELEPLLELPIEQLAAQIQADAELVLARAEPYDEQRPSVQQQEVSTSEHAKVSERAELSYQIQRSIDRFQIGVRSRWRRQLRALSLGISLILTTLVASVFGLWQVNYFGTMFVVLLNSALACFFASVARDAVAVLERLRRW
jgi:hypothetical protein